MHGGDYYVYATYYFGKKRIEAIAKFVVIDGEIELDPKEGAVGTEVRISGEGLRQGQKITIAMSGISKIEASDGSFNTAEAQLTIFILAIPADISLRPTTSQTSPGYVGMELTINGTRFIANTMITITYSNNEDITVATATTDADGDFSATFTVPPSVAGSHTVTSTDGISTATVIFIMESEAPPMPVPLLPKVASTAEAEAYFDWTDIEDPSGVTYTLQVALDADFTTIVLQREGLLDSEYTITEEEKLESTEKEPPYYWRVKAVDGASNESDWTPRVILCWLLLDFNTKLGSLYMDRAWWIATGCSRPLGTKNNHSPLRYVVTSALKIKNPIFLLLIATAYSPFG